MNWKHIFAITGKDLREVQQNKSALISMIAVPLVFVLLLPLGFIFIPQIFKLPTQAMAGNLDIKMILERIPEFMKVQLTGLNEMQTLIVLVLGYLFAPMFLIFPLMISTTIASESFAGERERKTLEALLYTPATDAELFLGKVLAAAIPAVLITWISFVGYTLVLNLAAFPLFGRIWFPLAGWYPLIAWVTPAVTIFGIAITVLISTRVQTFMGAYQSSASTVILVLGLMVGQIAGVLYFSVGVGILLGCAIWLVDGVLAYFAIRTFNRTRLLISAA